jgi:hypothetical protein
VLSKYPRIHANITIDFGGEVLRPRQLAHQYQYNVFFQDPSSLNLRGMMVNWRARLQCGRPSHVNASSEPY